MWELRKHEYIPETQDLAAIDPGYTCLFKEKYTLSYYILKTYFRILVLKTCMSQRYNENLPLNKCVAHLQKSKNSEVASLVNT